MSFIRGGETIQIKRRSATSVDDYGNTQFSTTTITVKDVLVAIGSTGEPVDESRDPVDTQLTLYLPNGTAIQDGDLFVIRGTTWVKDGTGFQWVSPFGSQLQGVVVPVRRRRG